MLLFGTILNNYKIDFCYLWFLCSLINTWGLNKHRRRDNVHWLNFLFDLWNIDCPPFLSNHSCLLEVYKYFASRMSFFMRFLIPSYWVSYATAAGTVPQKSCSESFVKTSWSCRCFPENLLTSIKSTSESIVPLTHFQTLDSFFSLNLKISEF